MTCYCCGCHTSYVYTWFRAPNICVENAKHCKAQKRVHDLSVYTGRCVIVRDHDEYELDANGRGC